MQNPPRQHTAGFQVSYFLNSKVSIKLPFVKKLLNCHSRSILRYLADLMDMEFSHSNKRHAGVSQSQIAIYAGTSLRTVNRYITLLVKYRMLKVQSKGDGEKKIYTLGRYITTYASLAYGYTTEAQVTTSTTPTYATEAQGVRQSGVGGTPQGRTSNNASNNLSNKKQNAAAFNRKSKAGMESEQDRKDREHLEQQILLHEQNKQNGKTIERTIMKDTIKQCMDFLKTGRPMNGLSSQQGSGSHRSGGKAAGNA